LFGWFNFHLHCVIMVSNFCKGICQKSICFFLLRLYINLFNASYVLDTNIGGKKWSRMMSSVAQRIQPSESDDLTFFSSPHLSQLAALEIHCVDMHLSIYFMKPTQIQQRWTMKKSGNPGRIRWWRLAVEQCFITGLSLTTNSMKTFIPDQDQI